MTDTGSVLQVNDALYGFMRAGNAAGMERIWARHRDVTCSHPGRAAISGRAAVLNSWRMILANGGTDIWPDDPCVVVTGGTAMVVVIERIGSVRLMASNTFIREDGLWRVLSHLAAPMPATNARR